MIVPKRMPLRQRGTRRQRRSIETIEYSPAALSSWGRRVMWAKAEFGLSYRHIAKEARLHHMVVRKMVVEPGFTPNWLDGQTFLRWYKLKQRESSLQALR